MRMRSPTQFTTISFFPSESPRVERIKGNRATERQSSHFLFLFYDKTLAYNLRAVVDYDHPR